MRGVAPAASGENPRPRFRIRAWPRQQVPAVAVALKHRMDRTRPLRNWWSRSSPLFKYLEDRCSAPGRTAAQRRRGAFGLVARDAGRRHAGRGDGALEEGPADAASRWSLRSTSTTWPCSSMARKTYRQRPPILRSVSSTRQRAPARVRCARAASTKRGRERLDPVVDRARVDGDAPLGQPLGDLHVAQAIAEVPATCPRTADSDSSCSLRSRPARVGRPHGRVVVGRAGRAARSAPGRAGAGSDSLSSNGWKCTTR